MFMNIPEVTPPPHSYSGGSSLSPNAVQQSETTATDTEEPAAAEIEDIEKDDNEYSHSNHSRHSRENSMSRIEKLIVQQEDYKKNSKTLSKLAINLFPPQHYDDHNDEDDEMDDENFEKILLNFTRQESQSNDKRRSMSKSNSSNYSLYRRPSPNRATNYSLYREMPQMSKVNSVPMQQTREIAAFSDNDAMDADDEFLPQTIHPFHPQTCHSSEW
eukprot:100118_1